MFLILIQSYCTVEYLFSLLTEYSATNMFVCIIGFAVEENAGNGVSGSKNMSTFTIVPLSESIDEVSVTSSSWSLFLAVSKRFISSSFHLL